MENLIRKIGEPDSLSPNFKKKPGVIFVVKMTGSGQKTFLNRLVYHTQASNIRGYVMNLDPAVLKLPFGANIDIRDTVNYKKAMKEFNLGPNGGILTPLNMFATKFDEDEEGSYIYMLVGASNIRDLLTEFSSSLDFFAISSGDGRIKIWDTVKGQIKTIFADIVSSGKTKLYGKSEQRHLSVDYACMKWLALDIKENRKLGSSLLVLGMGSGDVLTLDLAAGQLKWRVSDCHPGGVMCKLEAISGNSFGNFRASARGIYIISASSGDTEIVEESLPISKSQKGAQKHRTHGDSDSKKSDSIDWKFVIGWLLGLCGFMLISVAAMRYYYWKAARRVLAQQTLVRQAFVESIPTHVFSPTTEGGTDCVGERCSICLDDFETGSVLRLLPCGHLYHLECLHDLWRIGRPLICVMCRRDYERRRQLDRDLPGP